MVRVYVPNILKAINLGKMNNTNICINLKSCKGSVPYIKNPIPKIPLIYSNLTKNRFKNEILRILVITDSHVDLNYKENISKSSGMPLSCNKITSFLPKNKNDFSGFWASPDACNCDIPLRTLESLVKFLSKQNIDLVIFGGDSPSHDLWIQTEQKNFLINNLTANIMKKYFKVPIYYVIGNHLVAGADQMPGTKDFFVNAISPYIEYLGKDQINTFKVGGFYTKSLARNIRLIVLNTNFYNDNNLYLTIGYRYDWKHQMAWLIDVLNKSSKLNEKVILLKHHPSSSQPYQNYLENIIKKYKKNIIVIIVGHDHNGNLLLVNDVNQFTIGSATTYSDTKINPGATILEINKNTKELINLHTIWSNSSLYSSKPIKWSYMFNFKKKLLINNLNNLTEIKLFLKNKENNITIKNIYNQWSNQI